MSEANDDAIARARAKAIAMIAAGAAFIVVGAVIWVLKGDAMTGAPVAGAGGAVETFGVLRLLRTLRKH